MKTLIALLVLALSGCASITKHATDDMAQVQLLLKAVLPPDFKGDWASSEKNMYFDYAIEVGGLHQLASGDWAFTYLSFDGAGHFPLTPALSWNGEHHIHLGTKPTP